MVHYSRQRSNTGPGSGVGQVGSSSSKQTAKQQLKQMQQMEQQLRSHPVGLMTYLSNMRKLFKSHGEFCASQPWEVIVTTITFLVCLLTVMGKQSIFTEERTASGVASCPAADSSSSQTCKDGAEPSSQMENIVMTLIRCLAVLHCYYRFKKIHRMGSTFIMKIAGAYLAFTLALFLLIATSLGAPSSMKVRLLYDSWFMVLLLMDMQRVSRMAQFALSSSHHRRIAENIAHGMYVLAPTFTMDTMIKVMLMGVGSLTGIPKLEVYAWYAVVFNMVNFIVYMTFFPAGLSLVLELMYCTDGRPRWDVRQIIQTLPSEDSTSPVVHKVKIVGIASLLILHIVCHRPLIMTAATLAEHMHDPAVTQYSTIRLLVYLLFTNLEQIMLIAIMLVLSVKYLIYDGDVDEAQSLRKKYIEELNRKLSEEETTEMVMEETCKDDQDHVSNSTDEGIGGSRVGGGGNGGIGGGSSGSGPGTVSSCGSTGGHRMIINLEGEDHSSTDSTWSETTTPDFKDSGEPHQNMDFISSSDAEEEAAGLVAAARNAPAMRSLDECVQISRLPDGPPTLTDEEILMLIESKHIRTHVLEKVLCDDYLRGVDVRRKYIERSAKLNPSTMNNIPFKYYDYKAVMGACAESVIGYMTLPLGVVGPLKLDGKTYTVPMATTEGCLVASTNRGCSALRECGVTSSITDDGMSRAPVLRFPNCAKAVEAKAWMEEPEHFQILKGYFDSTSRFARLKSMRIRIAGRMLYVRFVARTGDAMGMNMLSKGVEFTLNKLMELFPEMTVLSLSGNVCSDKKPAAINWIEGRGKSVVCEAIVPKRIVSQTLKTTTADLCDLNSAKNQTGSAIAGSIGGFNAHAANIVTAIFIATGQDAAQNVGSSNCMTLMEPWGPDGRDLFITCTMPCIEVGTVGGGTVLAAQSACLEMLGVKGSHPTHPGQNASQLARVVCAAVLAGELSLMSALAAGHLVKSHLRHNRSTAQFGASPATPAGGASGTAIAAPAPPTPLRMTSEASLTHALSSSTLCSSLGLPSGGLVMRPIPPSRSNSTEDNNGSSASSSAGSKEEESKN